MRLSVFATVLGLLLCPAIVSAQPWQPVIAGTKGSVSPLTETTNPSNPTITSSTPLNTIISQFTNTWSPAQAFVGANTFVSPNFDNDTYQISGDYLIIAPNGPGVGSAGGTTQHVTTAAVQKDISTDGTISNAPSGAMLANTWGIWNWGPIQSGRSIGGGGFVGGYVLYLNGKQRASGDTIEVAHSGVLYLFNSSFGWFTWNGTAFVSSGAP